MLIELQEAEIHARKFHENQTIDIREKEKKKTGETHTLTEI